MYNSYTTSNTNNDNYPYGGKDITTTGYNVFTHISTTK